MMKPMYYNDYYKRYNVQYVRGRYNIVSLPCGSGKTFHCLDFITEKREYKRRGGKEANLSRCLYVTDTSALKESVISAYEKHTNKRVESTQNIDVITYAKFALMLYDKKGTTTKQLIDNAKFLAQSYDYIFLDEIHQLFLYSERYDGDDDKAEYQDIIDSLSTLVDYTTLICLSSTPRPLVEYLDEIDEAHLIHNCIPIADKPLIKAYTTTYSTPIFDTRSFVENINLQPQDKLFIFANTIQELLDLEKVCQDKGYSTLALWSIKYNKMKSDDEEEEMKLALRRMSPHQLEARERLLKDGEYTEQVLLLNGAYESGINIENGADSEQRTIYVVVSSTSEYTIEQARGRIRHNIDALYYLSHDWYEAEGKGVENNQALVGRLDQLVDECEEDEYRFIGKQGLNEIATKLNIWFAKINKKGKNKGRAMAKSMRNINNQLILMELPYEIKQESCRPYINGKQKKVTYYIVVRDEPKEEDSLTKEELDRVLTNKTKRRNW